MKIGRIFEGQVRRMLGFGAIVGFDSKYKYNEGLVHISNIKTFRVRDIEDVIRKNDIVYVKVLDIKGRKISLSMKDVDQENGQDCVVVGSKMRQVRMQKVFQEQAINMDTNKGERLGFGTITGVKLNLDKKNTERLDKNLGNCPDPWEETRYDFIYHIYHKPHHT